MQRFSVNDTVRRHTPDGRREIGRIASLFHENGTRMAVVEWQGAGMTAEPVDELEPTAPPPPRRPRGLD